MTKLVMGFERGGGGGAATELDRRGGGGAHTEVKTEFLQQRNGTKPRSATLGSLLSSNIHCHDLDSPAADSTPPRTSTGTGSPLSASSTSPQFAQVQSPENLAKQTSGFLEYMLVRHRWVLVCFFLLPASFFYNIWMYLRSWIIFRLSTAPRAHDSKVENVQHQIREWNMAGRPSPMCTARNPWENVSNKQAHYKKRNWRIKINLVDILKVDAVSETLAVEPMATMGQITAMLTPLGWSLSVIPELDDLTVGGLICGEGIEASSHRYGLFQNILVACDVVLADGSLIRCTADRNSDLFYSIPWSHGTLGFLVSATLKISRIQPFVKLEYFPVVGRSHVSETFARASQTSLLPYKSRHRHNAQANGKHQRHIGRHVLKKAFAQSPLAHKSGEKEELIEMQRSNEIEVEPVIPLSQRVDNDFVEGIAFSQNSAVIMVGTMVAAPTRPSQEINRIGRFWKPWFYKHVEKVLLDSEMINADLPAVTEYIPFADFCHRHSRSIFWEIRDIIPFGNHPVFRYTCGWLCPPKISLLKLTETPTIRKLYEQAKCIQDLLIPVERLSECLDFLHQTVQSYPIWLCPMVVHDKPGMVGPSTPDKRAEMFVDVGIYGTAGAPAWHFSTSSRQIEAFTRRVKGFQMLYGECYHTREEFREMLDHRLYDSLREKYNCNGAFLEVYDKIKKNA